MISGIAYGAVDPTLYVRAVTPADPAFNQHLLRAVEDVAFRFSVRQRLLVEAWRTSVPPCATEVHLDSDVVELVLDADQQQEFTLGIGVRAEELPPGIPVVLASSREDGSLLATSDIGVLFERRDHR